MPWAYYCNLKFRDVFLFAHLLIWTGPRFFFFWLHIGLLIRVLDYLSCLNHIHNTSMISSAQFFFQGVETNWESNLKTLDSSLLPVFYTFPTHTELGSTTFLSDLPLSGLCKTFN